MNNVLKFIGYILEIVFFEYFYKFVGNMLFV